MAAAGKCRKRMRAAREKDGEAEKRPRKGQAKDLATKKRHVRELAMAGRFQEIKRHYGGKMMAKAKDYAEKQRAKHTPQSLARDLLLRNGYAASDSRTEPGTPESSAAAPVNAEGSRGHQGNEPVKRVQSELPTSPEPPQPPRVSISPESLTADQLELIERRRREALERRRRKDALAACALASATSMQQQSYQAPLPVPVCAPRAAEAFQADESTFGAESSGNAATEGYSSGAALGAGLTIAGHYVHELEDDGSHLIPDAASQEARMVEPFQIPVTCQGGVVDSGQQAAQPPLVVSISQELAAAADIVMWEQQIEALEESAGKPSVSVISVSDDDDADVPRFKLLPTPEETFELNQPAETMSTSCWAGTATAGAGSTVGSGAAAPAVNYGPVETQQVPVVPNLKRTWQGQPSHNVVAAAQRPKPSDSHTDASARQQATSRSNTVIRSNEALENRSRREEDTVEKLIDQHRLDNGLDSTLLQFIDMILS